MLNKFTSPEEAHLQTIPNLALSNHFPPDLDIHKKHKKKNRKKKRRDKRDRAKTLETDCRQLIWETGYLSAENRILHEIIKVGTAAANRQLNVKAMTIAGEVLEDDLLYS